MQIEREKFSISRESNWAKLQHNKLKKRIIIHKWYSHKIPLPITPMKSNMPTVPILHGLTDAMTSFIPNK